MSKRSPVSLLRRVKSDETGSSLLLSSMLLVVGLLMTAGIFYLSSASYRITLRSIEHTKAQYNAEAGVYRAISQLSRDPDWVQGFSSISFGEGSYTVRIEVVEDKSTAATVAKGKNLAAEEETAGEGEETEAEDSTEKKKPAKIVLLKAEGNSGKSKSLIEVRYDTGSGKILSWSE